MKKIILSLALSLFALTGFSQTDPTVTNPTVTPAPLGSPFATLSFVFANLGPDPISHLDPDGIPDPIVLTITMSNGTWDDVNYADPVDAIGGSYSAYFTWTYNTTTNSYIGVQNQPVLGFDGGDITIAYKATMASPQTAPANGFTVNLTSNGNAPNGPGTNDITNDAASAKTYGPLPVTLVSFSVAREGSTSQLKWATTEETNSDHFEIQHSVTGKEWAPVGEVSSHGESSSLKNYTYSHSTPLNGENLYRLKMVDKDQTFTYSRIRSVKFEGLTEADLSVYPNPVTDKLNIRDVSGVAQINIYDLKGVSLYQSVNPKTTEINVKDLSAGMYVVKIQRANGLSSSQKIVVNK